MLILPKERNQNRTVAKVEDIYRNQENLSGILAANPQRHFAYRRLSNQMIIGVGGVGIDTTDSCSTERFRISSMVLVCA